MVRRFKKKLFLIHNYVCCSENFLGFFERNSIGRFPQQTNFLVQHVFNARNIEKAYGIYGNIYNKAAYFESARLCIAPRNKYLENETIFSNMKIFQKSEGFKSHALSIISIFVTYLGPIDKFH